MTLELLKQEERRKGEDRLAELIKKLCDNNRRDEIENAVTNVNYREKLFAEFGL